MDITKDVSTIGYLNHLALTEARNWNALVYSECREWGFTYGLLTINSQNI